MTTLHTLDKTTKKRKRRGRGGSRGGTSGAGHKGQKARSGGLKKIAFEGGQMPLYRRLPKRGFNNKIFAKQYAIVSVGQLNDLFNDGDTVNKEILTERGIIRSTKSSCVKPGVKILANGELKKKLIVSVDACSASAQEIITKAGGEVVLIKEK